MYHWNHDQVISPERLLGVLVVRYQGNCEAQYDTAGGNTALIVEEFAMSESGIVPDWLSRISKTVSFVQYIVLVRFWPIRKAKPRRIGSWRNQQLINEYRKEWANMLMDHVNGSGWIEMMCVTSESNGRDCQWKTERDIVSLEDRWDSMTTGRQEDIRTKTCCLQIATESLLKNNSFNT